MTLLSMGVGSQLPDAPPLPFGAFVFLDDVEDNRIQIRNIEGLGPVKAEFQTAPFALSRGVFFQGSSTGARNIVLTLGLNPLLSGGESMADLRNQIYRYFMPELQLTLYFHTNHLSETLRIDGFVESVEPNIFSQDPEMQISIICPRPDFIGDDLHQFFGDVVTTGETTEIEYTGTVSHGFDLLVSNDDHSYDGPVRITNVNGSFHENFLVGHVKLNSDKRLRLATVPTRRRVQSEDVSSGIRSSLLGRMVKTSTWPVLFPGTNEFKVKALVSDPTWHLTYFNRYGGL